MDESKKKEFDELSFSELMKRPKPDLCDYIVEIRQPAVVIIPRHEFRSYESVDVAAPAIDTPTIDYSKLVVENKDSSYQPEFDVVEKEYDRKELLKMLEREVDTIKKTADNNKLEEIENKLESQPPKKRRGRKKKNG